MTAIQKELLNASDGLKVVRLRVSAGQQVPEHHANVDVVATVVSGQGTFTVAGQSRAIAPGAVIVMAPRERHSIAADSDLELVVVHARLAEAGDPAACGA
jgi:quercetin dioxygenase-like cupin family protein